MSTNFLFLVPFQPAWPNLVKYIFVIFLLQATRITANMKILVETQDQVKAMDSLREETADAGLSVDPIVYNRAILFAESHKVLQLHLFNNLCRISIVIFT